MSEFTLAGEDINVNAFSGFDRPDDAHLVSIISTDTSDHDTVVQGGNVPSPLATLGGRTSDFEQILLLRFWRNSHGAVLFVEPDEGAHVVSVLTLEVHKVAPTPFLWDWTAQLIELQAGTGAGGSGSGS